MAAPAATAAEAEEPTTGAAPEAPAEDPGLLNGAGGFSRWAYVEAPTYARRAPSATARRIGRLRTRTQDGTDELVMLLEQRRDERGRMWVKARLPMRPTGVEGWIPRHALGRYRRLRTWLLVERRRFRITLVRNGRIVFRARIGVGQRRWPTPAGRFYIRERLSGYPSGSIYGPVAFGTSAHSRVLTDWPGGGVIGIHGTNQPQLLPGRVSHGCIRLRNRDILRLARLLPLGTPLTIR